jgi:hypothetical protein
MSFVLEIMLLRDCVDEFDGAVDKPGVAVGQEIAARIDRALQPMIPISTRSVAG